MAIKIDLTDQAAIEFDTANGPIRVLDPARFFALAVEAEKSAADDATYISKAAATWSSAKAETGVLDTVDGVTPTESEKSLILKHVVQWVTDLGKDGAGTQTSTRPQA